MSTNQQFLNLRSGKCIALSKQSCRRWRIHLRNPEDIAVCVKSIACRICTKPCTAPLQQQNPNFLYKAARHEHSLLITITSWKLNTKLDLTLLYATFLIIRHLYAVHPISQSEYKSTVCWPHSNYIQTWTGKWYGELGSGCCGAIQKCLILEALKYKIYCNKGPVNLAICSPPKKKKKLVTVLSVPQNWVYFRIRIEILFLSSCLCYVIIQY